MDQRVTISSPVYTSPPDEIASWATVAEVYAAVEFLAGDEEFEAQRETSKAWAYFYIKHRSVSTLMRVTHRSVDYDIRDVQDLDGKRENLRLRCRSVR